MISHFSYNCLEFITSIRRKEELKRLIQVEEGKQQMFMSNKAMKTIDLFTQVEIIFLIMMAIIVQVIIFFFAIEESLPVIVNTLYQ